MAAATGFWNRRGVLNAYRAGSKISTCKEIIDTEVVIDTVSRLGAIQRKLKLPQIWSEAAIIKALIYKHGNQHGKEKHFQGLKKVVKCLSRLQEVRIFDKVAEVKSKFPRISKRGTLVAETLFNSPSIESIIGLLGYLTGVAQLLLQIMSSCQETFQYSCAQMAFGYFLTFHITCSSSLSRIWVLTRGFLHNIAECYDVIFPWLNHLADPHQIETTEAKDLSRSLKTWPDALKAENFNKNSNSLTPSTKAFKPGTLDKLFASTPRQKPEESLPRPSQQVEESLVGPSSDLGESFISGVKVDWSLEKSEALTANESLILRRKLFAKTSEIAGRVQTLAEDCSAKGDVTNAKKRTAGITENVSRTSTKKLKADAKASFKRGPGRFSYGKKIHIYSNKKWKLCIEKTRQRKVMKSKMRNTEANNLRQKSLVTQWMGGVQNKIGETSIETMNNKSETVGTKYSKSTCTFNLPNNFSPSGKKNTKAVVKEMHEAFSEGFVQLEMSSLFGKFKHSSLNSGSCYKQLGSLETQIFEETSEKEDFEDEIDSIFNALD